MRDENSLVRITDIVNTRNSVGIISVSRSTWIRWVYQGKAPKGVKIGGVTLWRYGEVIKLGNASGD